MLLLFFLLINAENDPILSMGLTTDFKMVPGSSKECNFHDSCYDTLCNAFKSNTSCVSYVVFVPISDNLSCGKFLPHREVDMIVVGFNLVPGPKITTHEQCHSIGECFHIACQLLNSNYNVKWVGYTGKCL
jgi:hypothetical protein